MEGDGRRRGYLEGVDVAVLGGLGLGLDGDEIRHLAGTSGGEMRKREKRRGKEMAKKTKEKEKEKKKRWGKKGKRKGWGEEGYQRMVEGGSVSVSMSASFPVAKTSPSLRRPCRRCAP